MAKLSDIRKGLRDAAATVTTLDRAYAYAPDKPEPPCAVVMGPDPIDFDEVYANAGHSWTIPVRIYATRSSGDEAAQLFLDDLLDEVGANSIKRRIENDVTLGGLVDSVRMTQMRNYGPYQAGDVFYLGFEVLVEVLT